MNSIFKKTVLLWTIFFTSLLFADGDDIGITIYNAPSVHEDSGTMSFTIELSEAPDWCEEVTVDYITSDGSATAGEDYTDKNGSVTFYGFCPNPFNAHTAQTTKTVTVDITNTPATYEPNEYLYMSISNSTVGYFLDDSRGYGYIVDNNLVPLKLTLHNKSETEQDSNWVLKFTARLNRSAPAGGVTIGYKTLDSSATAGDDYIATTGSITIAEGDTDGFIDVTIIGDTLPEPTDTENFKVKITSISQGSVTNTDNEAKATITDDDKVKVDISSLDVNEGNSGDSNKMAFKIFLAKDYPNIADLTINYTTEDGSDPSATLANSDYIKTLGSVTFTHGEIEKIINVPIIGDDTIEPHENLKMTISGSSYIINSGVSESKIINDDGSYPSVDFSTGDVSIIEGNSSTQILNFHFTLDADALAGSSFDYYTQDDEAKVSDNDYTQINTTTYNIPVGTRDIDIPVTIIGDTHIEEDEIFYLKFTNENNITINGHTAKGHILNDDGAYPNLTFDMDSYSTGEGDSGQKDINFTITLDAPALVGSSFDYYTQDNTAQVSDSDYIKIDRKTYLIPERETQITIPVKVNGDTNIENNERFYLKIDNEHNLTISGTQSPTGEIINDDGNLSEFSIEALVTEGSEGNSGTKNLVFTIKLDTNATEDGVSIQYQTVDGTARDRDNDYEKISTTTVIFNEGESEKTLFVKMNGDTKVEDNETFSIELLNPHRATLSEDNSSVEFTIINDDEHNDDPFECKDNDMYISSSTNRETGDTEKMWLHKIDTTQNPFGFQVVNQDGASEIYNATAYNPDDNYIYGLYHRELVKLSKTGKVTSLGIIAELPDRFDTKQLYAGAIYGGFYYVSGRRTKLKELYKINLNDANKTVTPITLTLKVAIQDFSFSHDGKYLYGVDRQGKLTTIEVANGTVTQKGIDHTGYEFDSTFSDKNGRFFANDSNGNGFFEFNLATGDKQFLSNSQPATYNDGANCLNASLVFTDYGDAPSSYGEASHDIRGGIFMGDEVDHDINPYFSVEADGDDSNGIDDEDGVTLADGTDINGTYFKLDTEQNLTIKVSKDGYLNAWIDYNIDGDFKDAGEKIFDQKSLTTGTNSISFKTPNTITKENQTSYIRFRYSSTQNLDSNESASDGEVEDYAIKFGDGVIPLKGVFNIERTNSNASTINSDARNAWYTQIVGRDFDYSIVFYEDDLSAQKEIDRVVIKLELVNMENNSSLYERYFYIKNTPPVSRKDIIIATDLDTLPAVKDARFRISYGVDDDGSLLQIDCNTAEKVCYDMLPKIRTDYAKDNFAIRPETFYIKIADKSQEISNSRHMDETLRVSSGYEYNLTMIATKYGSIEPSLGYNKDFNALFELNTTGVTNCANTTPITEDIKYRDGIENILDFKHDNVGHYILTQVADENWASVDKNSNDCIIDDANTSANGNSKSGCNIKLQIHPINLEFYPDHFNIDLNILNLPNSGHPDFIYMMELNSTNNDVAIAFQGEITAQSENNQTTTNFTAGCVATNLLLDLNATTISDTGINTPVRTEDNNSDVNFSRVIIFNNETNKNNFDINRTLAKIGNIIPVTLDKFSNENNGTIKLDMRYNINKNLTKAINPVEVTFNKIKANSVDANSVAHTTTTHIPLGEQAFTNNVKNFYFARVVSNLNSYPRININISPYVRTPLNVDIYCRTTIPNYCQDRNVTENTTITGTIREQNGWYLSTNHDGELDGNVTALIDNPDILTIMPDPTPTGADDIILEHGANNLINTIFDSCPKATPSSTVTITTSPALTFNPSQYIVNCTDVNSSQWGGLGKTGNIINVKPRVNKSGKMDW